MDNNAGKIANGGNSGSKSGNRYDVIVVGVGSVGACACWELAKRGAKVLGLDRFSIPNKQASYVGDTRVFRTAYFEHPDYVPLLQRSRELWLELGREAGELIYLETGGLYLGPIEPTPTELMIGTLRAAEEHHLPHTRLDHDALSNRFPQFTVPVDFQGVFEPHAGVVFSERAVAAAARLAVERGAVLHENEPVREWSVDSVGVTVRSDRDTYHADRLVICSGVWSLPLLRNVSIYLNVTRQALAWFEPKDAQSFHADIFPIWALDCREPLIHYGFPVTTNVADIAPGLKIARHFPGAPADPETIDRTATAGELQAIRDAAGRFLPGAGAKILSSRVCMYTNTPDGHFLIDTYPSTDRVFYCAGLSGHGFKCATALGEALAECALTGRTHLPIEFLSVNRFRE